jgi:hypothetical protein
MYIIMIYVRMMGQCGVCCVDEGIESVSRKRAHIHTHTHVSVV